jgi:uncharacterized repeat protein (TIGR03803 family)
MPTCFGARSGPACNIRTLRPDTQGDEIMSQVKISPDLAPSLEIWNEIIEVRKESSEEITMKPNGLAVHRARSSVIAIISVSLMFASIAWASGPIETTLYPFMGQPDGAGSSAPVVFDKDGNLYGTTENGGQFGYGAVFELSPPGVEGGEWTETILHSFQSGNDGSAPSSGVILDSKGALYGETLYGGVDNNGVVFKLTPPGMQGGIWAESILYGFCPVDNNCMDGANPLGGLVFDKKGNLYGTTYEGGPEGCCGVVFELIKPSGKQAAWTENPLYTFVGNYNGQADGYSPEAGVIFDKAGNLYGTTLRGGNSPACGALGCGTVFELSPEGESWTESILYSFQGTGDGEYVVAGLVFDKSGALYGTTVYGGTGYGNVFKLSPPVGQGDAWTESVLYDFGSVPTDGSYPAAGVIFDGKDLYGTTTWGGSSGCEYGYGNVGCGTVFKLAPPKIGSGTWAEKILWNCSGNDSDGGHDPSAALTLNAGAFYSTTSDGSGQNCQFGCGAVFELVP